jgi:hypothetical protein
LPDEFTGRINDIGDILLWTPPEERRSMARKKKGRGSFEGEFDDFVPAVFARSPQEAEEYRELLNDHDIPAIIHSDDEEQPPAVGRAAVPIRTSISRGVPVLVPEALLDEASGVIADREDTEEFQAGEDDVEEEEEDDELGISPARGEPGDEEEAETEEEEDAPARPKAGANPFAGEEDAFDVGEEEEEEEDETPLLAEEEDIDLEEDEELEEEEDEEELEEEEEEPDEDLKEGEELEPDEGEEEAPEGE